MSYSEDIEDLLGESSETASKRKPAARQHGRSGRTKTTLDGAVASRKRIAGGDPDGIINGVSVTWLARVFDMDPATCRKYLVGCPVMRYQGTTPIYDVKEASRWLVKPALSAEQMLKKMKSTELPPAMQDSFWSAILKRQQAEERARDLWRSEEVFAFLGDLLSTIRDTMQIAPTTIDRSHGLTDAQLASLEQIIDAMMGELHEKLRAKREEGGSKHYSTITEVEERVRDVS